MDKTKAVAELANTLLSDIQESKRASTPLDGWLLCMVVHMSGFMQIGSWVYMLFSSYIALLNVCTTIDYNTEKPSSKRMREGNSPVGLGDNCLSPIGQFHDKPPMSPHDVSVGHPHYSVPHQLPPWTPSPAMNWSSERDADDENSSLFSRTDIGLMVSISLIRFL